jgi:hypothetical protein
VVGTGHNWLLWNRNPDLFINRWQDPRLRADFLTNSLREPVLDLVDLVVLAGTPEWTGPSVSRIYRELLRFPHVPLVALGVGSGSPDIGLADYEREVLQRDNVLLTTRSQELAERINSLLSAPKALALPCPALFCTDGAPSPRSRPRVGLILQSSTVENQCIDEELVQRLLAALRRRKGQPGLELICFYVDEWMRFARLDPDRVASYPTPLYRPRFLLASTFRPAGPNGARDGGRPIFALSALIGNCSATAALAGNCRLRSRRGLTMSWATCVQCEGTSWFFPAAISFGYWPSAGSGSN